LLSFWTRSRRP